MSWDSQRRDGRTAVPCDELITIKGSLLSEDRKCLVIKTEKENVLASKGSFKYVDIPKGERFWVLARIGDSYKLVDYVTC